MFNDFRKILTPLLIILLLFSMVVIGAPTYVNVGPTTDFEGDVGIPDGSGYYINDILFSTLGLIDISTLAKTDGGIIVGDGTNFVLEIGATARASLGLTIGSDIQAYDAGLLSLAGLTYASPSFIKVTATDTYAVRTIAEVITDLALDSDDLSDVVSIAMLDENEILTGAWTISTGSIAGVDNTEFGYLDGVTSDIQTQLNAKLETEVDPTVDSDAEIKAILVDEVIKTGAFTAGRIAKINNATGIIEQGTNTDTDVADAVTKKHSQNTDTDLDATFEATFVKKADTVNVLSDITSPGANIEDAVTKKHSQNTDTALGTQTEDLNMGTHKIIGVVDPVNPQEAATKAYADTKVATEVDPTVDSDAEIKAILVDEVTKTGDFTASRLPEINNASGIIEQSDIEHKANGGYDFNANSAGFTTQTATGDGTTTCDWRTGLKFRFVFGAQNETFTFTNPEFSCHLQIIMIQDATGGRTATWPAGIWCANGVLPTLSTDGNARDIVNFFFDDYDDVYYLMGTGFAIP